MENKDSKVVRFLFDNHGVRGEYVSLNDSCRQLIENHDYSEPVASLMQDLAVIAVSVASTVKIDGQIMLQIRGGKGSKAVKSAIININNNLEFYGSASLVDGNIYDNDATFHDLIGENGFLHLTFLPNQGKRFEGIVELEGETLAKAFENYFLKSEQLATKFFLFSDKKNLHAAGLMLQIIPNIDGNNDSLDHLSILSETMTNEEMFSLAYDEILRRLFVHEDVRVFEPKAVSFKCICSHARCLNSIATLPLNDIKELSQKDDGIEMTCQHCKRKYHLTQKEIKDLALKNSQ